VNKAIKIGIIVACIVGAGVLFGKHFTKTTAVPEEGWQATSWRCSSCETTFDLTAREYKSVMQKQGYVTCVNCQSVECDEVYKCPHCNGYYTPFGHSMRGTHCPLCKAELPDEGAARLPGR